MGLLIWSVKEIVKVFEGWQKNDFDGLVVIDGNRGISKSTLAVKLAARFKQFKMSKDIVFSREDVMKHLATKKFGVILPDEMINVTYNREFWSEEQKKLIKMLNMYRDSCNIVIACIPNFWDLDNQFRTLVKMRINVVRRGLGIIHTKNQSSYSTDKWDKKINEKIEQKWVRKKIFKPQYQRLTTYRGIVRFGDLRKRQKEIYLRIKKLKRGHVFKIEEANSPEEQFYKVIMDKLIAGELTKDQLAFACLSTGKKYYNVLSRLNKTLKDNGSKKTASLYFIKTLGSEKPSPKHYNSIEQLKSDNTRLKVV